MYKELLDIPYYDTWTCIRKINEGWSKDLKFYIEDNMGKRFLLRLSHISQYEKKVKEFEIIKKINSLDFIMSKAIEIGVCNSRNNVYILLNWVNGTSLITAITDVTEKEQYNLGLEAGRILKQIHSIKVHEKDISKVDNKEIILNRIKTYENCSNRVENDEIAIDFVKNNINKVHNTPSVYLHGDFHVGNLLLTEERKLGVIDFNRWKCSDRYEEFYKTQSFDRNVSVPFSIGKIHGYFDFNPLEEFWEALAVYVAYSSLHSIAWAEKFGEDEVRFMTKCCATTFEDYKYFKEIKPSWYLDNYMKYIR